VIALFVGARQQNDAEHSNHDARRRDRPLRRAPTNREILPTAIAPFFAYDDDNLIPGMDPASNICFPKGDSHG